ncbi:hypothetical protein PSYAE_27718 [Pseudomonas amygdali pv. aesculi str. 0893_23]|nr:hypothetical protein PSYAE_27718 [Pseudomonas amygdali pv. aesculi str. 0893_23]
MVIWLFEPEDLVAQLLTVMKLQCRLISPQTAL